MALLEDRVDLLTRAGVQLAHEARDLRARLHDVSHELAVTKQQNEFLRDQAEALTRGREAMA